MFSGLSLLEKKALHIVRISTDCFHQKTHDAKSEHSSRVKSHLQLHAASLHTERKAQKVYMAVIKVWPVLASRILRSWLGQSEAHAGVQEPVTHLRKLFFAEGLHENHIYVNSRKFEDRFDEFT